MRNLRPKDQLYFLQKKGLIKEQLIKAWEDLRHPAAHASQVNPKKLQGYIDRYHAVTVLFHQLIFLAIGYTGCYTDYDSPGFPFEYFPFGPGKEEEQQQGVLETD